MSTNLLLIVLLAVLLAVLLHAFQRANIGHDKLAGFEDQGQFSISGLPSNLDQINVVAQMK